MGENPHCNVDSPPAIKAFLMAELRDHDPFSGQFERR